MHRLQYANIDRESERGKYLSLAVPYGGHLAKTKLRPPLYEMCPDVLIISDNFEQLMVAIKKFAKRGKSIYCHPIVKDGFWSWNVPDMKKMVGDILMSEGYKHGNVVILPANATLFKINHIDENGNETEHFTPLFDYGDSDKKLLKLPANKASLEVLSYLGREEKMIWTKEELPNSRISTLWSKRVITPKQSFEVLNNG